MNRTQILLPDELFRRAKRFGEEKEMSLAEMMRRGLELFLDRYPTSVTKESKPWKLPTFDGGLKVTADQLRDILDEEREQHAMHGLSS